MKLLIIGGVAGGATAAARARRLSEKVEITILEKGPYVSFANCGLPYYLSGEIKKRSQLLLQTPEGFLGRYGVQVELNTEALVLDRERKVVRAKTPEGEKEFPYDKLLLSQGGNPVIPPIPGADADHVFKLWTVPDMDRIDGYIKEHQPQTALVAGGGFIGLEMAEAFALRGLKVTVVELAPQVLGVMDPDAAQQVQQVLESHGVQVITGVGLSAIQTNGKVAELSNGQKIPADLVLFSVGVRPELTLAKSAGLTLGETGGLAVDEYLQTSDPSIWGAGDMVEVVHRVSGKKVRVPLAGPANRQGRIAATNALADLIGGKKLKYRGALGTSVVKVFDHTAAMTGLTEKAAQAAGFDTGVAVVHKDHHAGYYPGAQTLSLKLVFDRKNGKILGAQGFGKEGVEKRIDTVAAALAGGFHLEDLADLDLSYAPPYSSANDPLNLAAFVAQNDREGFSPLVTAGALAQNFDPDSVILDVRNLGEWNQGHVAGAFHIPVDELRNRLAEVPRDKKVYLHCKVGFRGHLALRILKENGWTRVWNITGGYTSMKAEPSFWRVFQEEK